MDNAKEQEEDKDLLELLQILDTATPVVSDSGKGLDILCGCYATLLTLYFCSQIPDSLMDYYMMKAGVVCDDVRLKRLIALLGQKFISDIANDAMHFHKMRQSSGSTNMTSANNRIGGAKKNTLSIEDLAAALSEYGINIKRPSYYM